MSLSEGLEVFYSKFGSESVERVRAGDDLIPINEL